ncbi:MAG: hypothetical protein WCP58_09765, partial [bacterium]
MQQVNQIQFDGPRWGEACMAPPSTRQGVLENEATRCSDRPCLGGFETRPYENRYSVNPIPGVTAIPETVAVPETAAPQCGKPEIAGFPGTDQTLEDHHRHDVREAGPASLRQHVFSSRRLAGCPHEKRENASFYLCMA